MTKIIPAEPTPPQPLIPVASMSISVEDQRVRLLLHDSRRRAFGDASLDHDAALKLSNQILSAVETIREAKAA